MIYKLKFVAFLGLWTYKVCVKFIILCLLQQFSVFFIKHIGPIYYRYISDLPMSLFAQVSIPWDHCNVCGLQQREEHSFHLGCVWIAVVKLWVIIVHLLWDMIKIFLYPFFTHIDILCSLSFQVCLLMFARTFQQGCTPTVEFWNM